MPATDLTGQFCAAPVRIGGGGFIQDVIYSAAAPGVRYAISDVGGAFRRDLDEGAPGEWVQMATCAGQGLDRGCTVGAGNYGTQAIAAHPTDPDIVLMSCDSRTTCETPGTVYRSTDGGRTFQPSDRRVDIDANDAHDKFPQRLAFDPGNPA